MTIAEDLGATRSELVSRGRVGGRMLNKQDGTVCLLGAMMMAVGEKPELSQAAHTKRVVAMSHALAAHLHDGSQAPKLSWNMSAERRKFFKGDLAVTLCLLYNDRPTTTDEDVFNLIDKALAELGAI